MFSDFNDPVQWTVRERDELLGGNKRLILRRNKALGKIDCLEWVCYYEAMSYRA